MIPATAAPPPGTWVVLPGLLLAPSDMEPVARVLREQFPAATVLVLDSWETAVTAPVRMASHRAKGVSRNVTAAATSMTRR